MSGLARWICGGLLALALPALAQPPARDYRPPPGISFQVADLISENVRLTAQWFQVAETEGRKLPTVIIAPGWGATAASLRQDAVDLARAGYRVMLFDYRGWGDSDGRVVPAPVRELRGYIDPWEQIEDGFNAISYAAADPRVDAGRIGLLGFDLSGGHVLYLAAHEPRVKALVSQVSRTDGRPSKPYDPDPARMIADANAAASRLATGQDPYPADRARAVGAKLLRWAPVDEAGLVTAPALFVLAENEALFSNANNGQLACERVMGPRKLVMLARTTHDDIYGAARPRAITAAIDWFDRYLKPAGAPTRIPLDPKAPERGACNPPPEPPRGEEDPNGSGEARKVQDATGRYN